MNDIIEKYLITRGLIDPQDMVAQIKENADDPILENDALLAEVAGMFMGHEEAIKAILNARIKPIVKELVMTATPAEVMVLRQAMVEVAYIYDVMEKYATEYARRKKEAEGNTKASEATPNIDNGEEPDNGSS